jgi:hypothetical protein
MSDPTTIAGIVLNDVILAPFAENNGLSNEDKNNIVQEYKLLGEQDLPQKVTKGSAKAISIPASWAYPGTSDKMINDIPKVWTLLTENVKNSILRKVLNRKAGGANVGAANTTNNRREPTTTKDDYARVLHVCKSYAHLIAEIHQIQSRQELDARKSKQRSLALPDLTLQDELNGWNQLVGIFNDTEEIYNNFTWTFDEHSNKVATESRFVSLLDRVVDIDPSDPDREERNADWFKKTWSTIKSTMTVVLSRFEQSGRHSGDDDSDAETLDVVEEFEADAVVSNDRIGKKMQSFTNLDW